MSELPDDLDRRLDTRSVPRRLFCGVLGAGALAGCLRFEGEVNEGAESMEDGDDRREGDRSTSDAGTTGDGETDENDSTDALELIEAWDGDGLTHAYVADRQLIGRDSPDVKIVSFDGELRWESKSSDPDSYSVWPNDGRALAENDEAIFVQYLSWGTEKAYDARIYAFDADDGTELWRHDTGDDRITAMTATEDVLYYATRPFDRDAETPIRALDVHTREYRWERTLGEYQHRPGALAVRDGLLYVPQYKLYVLDVDAGATQRELEISQAATGAMADDETMYLVGGGETAAVTLPDVTVEWTVDHDRHGGSVTIHNDVLYSGDGSGYVIAHDIPGDEQLWEHRVDSAVWSRLAVDAGTVWVYDDDGTVYAIDAESGERLYRRETDGGDGSVAAFDGRVYVPGPYYQAYDIERH